MWDTGQKNSLQDLCKGSRNSGCAVLTIITSNRKRILIRHSILSEITVFIWFWLATFSIFLASIWVNLVRKILKSEPGQSLFVKFLGREKMYPNFQFSHCNTRYDIHLLLSCHQFPNTTSVMSVLETYGIILSIAYCRSSRIWYGGNVSLKISAKIVQKEKFLVEFLWSRWVSQKKTARKAPEYQLLVPAKVVDQREFEVFRVVEYVCQEYWKHYFQWSRNFERGYRVALETSKGQKFSFIWKFPERTVLGENEYFPGICFWKIFLNLPCKLPKTASSPRRVRRQVLLAGETSFRTLQSTETVLFDICWHENVRKQ